MGLDIGISPEMVYGILSNYSVRDEYDVIEELCRSKRMLVEVNNSLLYQHDYFKIKYHTKDCPGCQPRSQVLSRGCPGCQRFSFFARVIPSQGFENAESRIQ